MDLEECTSSVSSPKDDDCPQSHSANSEVIKDQLCTLVSYDISSDEDENIIVLNKGDKKESVNAEERTRKMVMVDIKEEAKDADDNERNNYMNTDGLHICVSDTVEVELQHGNDDDNLMGSDLPTETEADPPVSVQTIKEEPKDINVSKNNYTVINFEDVETNIHQETDEIQILHDYRDQCDIDFSSDSDEDSTSTISSADSEDAVSSSSSSSVDSSSSSSDESDIINTVKAPVKEVVRPSKKKRHPFDEIELPPIEDLHISVEENEAKPIGAITQIVESQVVVQAYRNLPAIDLDSVLFLDCGKRSLGRVFDVFGPIEEPLYVVRFNSDEHLRERDVEKGSLVYFAPQTEYTSYVILSDLLSDASWKNDTEPPEQYLDYSDDEQERLAKQARRKKTSKGVVVINEFESDQKKPRNEKKNPFVRNYNPRSNYSRSRDTGATTPSCIDRSRNACNNANSSQLYRNKFHSDVRFGQPPEFIKPSVAYPHSTSVQSSNASLEFYRMTPPPPLSPFGNPPVDNTFQGFQSRGTGPDNRNEVTSFSSLSCGVSTHPERSAIRHVTELSSPPPPLPQIPRVRAPPPFTNCGVSSRGHSFDTTPPTQIYTPASSSPLPPGSRTFGPSIRNTLPPPPQSHFNSPRLVHSSTTPPPPQYRSPFIQESSVPSHFSRNSPPPILSTPPQSQSHFSASNKFNVGICNRTPNSYSTQNDNSNFNPTHFVLSQPPMYPQNNQDLSCVPSPHPYQNLPPPPPPPLSPAVSHVPSEQNRHSPPPWSFHRPPRPNFPS